MVFFCLYLPIIIKILQKLQRSIDFEYIFRVFFFRHIELKFVELIGTIVRFYSIELDVVLYLPNKSQIKRKKTWSTKFINFSNKKIKLYFS